MEITRHQGTGRMSRIVEHGDTIYLCGQTAKDANGNIEEQTTTTLEKIDELLKSVGSDKTKILSVTIYLTSINHFERMNKIWDAWVAKGNEPARACVEARMARDTLLVEMSVIAAVK